MSQGFSVTQGSNIAVFAAAIALVVKYFKPDAGITQEEVGVLLAAVATLVAAVISFINRFKKGDLTLGGFRK